MIYFITIYEMIFSMYFAILIKINYLSRANLISDVILIKKMKQFMAISDVVLMIVVIIQFKMKVT